jgi:hypothetical protein
LSVAADKRGIDLVLGKTPADRQVAYRARRRGRRAAGGGARAGGRRAPVPLHSDTARWPPSRRALRRMAAKLRAAISGDSRAAWVARAQRRMGRAARPGSVCRFAFYRQLVPGAGGQGLEKRTGFNCNQDCGMCWQDREWGRFGRSRS